MENPFELILEKLNSIELAIESLKESSKNVDEFMDIDQTASFLAMSKTTIYGMTHQRKIPYFKVGKRLFFKKSEIEQWIVSKRINTYDDLEKRAKEHLRKNPLI